MSSGFKNYDDYIKNYGKFPQKGWITVTRWTPHMANENATLFEWWLYRRALAPNVYMVIVSPGAAGDKQETEIFLRSFISRLKTMGGRIIDVSGGVTGLFRGDYLNDPARVQFNYGGSLKEIKMLLIRLNAMASAGLRDQVSDIVDNLTKGLGFP